MSSINKRGQVTIFIILALILVVIIALFFAIPRKPKIETSSDNPSSYIEKCMKDSLEDAETFLLEQGGKINPENYKEYEYKKIEYLCYTRNYYSPCISQYPNFIASLNKEIENYSKPLIETCFDNMKKDFEKKGYQVSMGNLEKLESELGMGTMKIYAKKNIEIAKGENSRKVDEFSRAIDSPLYDLAVLAVEIASQEAKYCYFSYDGYMILYPEFEIEKFQTGDNTKIYTLNKKGDNRKLNIAIRSCVMPPGL
jgi:hypothetical protein